MIYDLDKYLHTRSEEEIMGRYHRPGPPRRHGSRGFGGSFVGGIVGGFVGSAIANSGDSGPAQSSPTLEAVLKRVTQVPVGGTAFLKVEEYRILADKGLIQFKDTIPYCMERIVEV